MALVLTACAAPAVPGEQEEEEEEGGQQEEEEEEEEEGIPALNIGETFKSPEVEVTISEAMITDSYESYDKVLGNRATEEASPGTSFLIIHVALKNVGTKSRWGKRGPDRMQVTDAEGNVYQAESSSTTDAIEGALLEGTGYWLPGKTNSGKVVYVIPEGASGLKIHYQQIWPPIYLAEWVIE